MGRVKFIQSASIVQRKSDYMEDVTDRVATDPTEIEAVSVGVALISAVVYTVLSLILSRRRADENQKQYREGVPLKKLLTRAVATEMICALLISGVTFATLFLAASARGFVAASMEIVCLFSLPVLASLFITVPAAKRFLPRTKPYDN